MAIRPPVLYAEDEDNDAFLMQRAFAKARMANPLQVVADGAAAVDTAGTIADRRATRRRVCCCSISTCPVRLKVWQARSQPRCTHCHCHPDLVKPAPRHRLGL
jgi:hypothetical protein